MDLERLVDENYSRLTSTDRLMIQEIFQCRDAVSGMNSTQLSRHLNVSRTTFVRLIKKLGLNTYAEFQLLLNQKKKERTHEKLNMQEIADSYHGMIDELQKHDYTGICKKIAQADTIFLYGTGNEQKAIVEEFKRIFMILGKYCVNLFDYGEIEFARRRFAANDMFIAVSLSGENQEALRVMRMIKETDIHTLSITRWKNNSLARFAEDRLYVGTKFVQQDDQMSYEMIAAFYILLDILSVRYLEYIRRLRDEEEKV